MAYLQKFYKNPVLEGTGTAIIGKSSEVFAKGDPVSIDTDGFLIYSTAGSKIIGFSLEDVTMSATNGTVAKYCPQWVPSLGVKMVYKSDQDCTQTDVGAYADLVGTTGATQINLAAGATGQFLVLAFNPDGLGDNYVVVEVAEPQTLGFAQS